MSDINEVPTENADGESVNKETGAVSLTPSEFLEQCPNTDDYNHDRFEVVEEGDWVQDMKRQHITSIFLDKEVNEYWALHQSREGSYHTDWYYDTPTANRVDLHVEYKQVKSWVALNI